MEIVKSKERLLLSLEKLKKFQSKTAFVPTMGNLHDGHIKLIETSKRLAEHTVCSIFVNKKQFGASEDFESYPRTEEADIERLEKAGCSLLYLPRTEADVFGSAGQFQLKLDVPSLTNSLCGLSRPDFFGGVLAVVLKLFLQIKPDFAVFGKKDYQQFLVVSALAKALDIGIEVVGIDIVREASGLALSSRNNYFTGQDRAKASFIYQELSSFKQRTGLTLEQNLAISKQNLINEGIEKIDYLEIRSGRDLTLLSELTPDKKPILFFAGFFRGVRLIDNIEL